MVNDEDDADQRPAAKRQAAQEMRDRITVIETILPMLPPAILRLP